MIGKKGSAQDLLFIMVIALFFSVVVLLGFKIMSEIDDQVQDSDAIAEFDDGGYARAASTKLKSTFTGALDGGFLLLVIGLSIIAIVLASLVRVHPAFMVLFIIVWVILLFFSGVFSNIYQEMAANSQLTDVASQLTMISTVMNYLPLFIGVIGALLMIIMHKVYQNDQY